jgi:hypothetical protein
MKPYKQKKDKFKWAIYILCALIFAAHYVLAYRIESRRARRDRIELYLKSIALPPPFQHPVEKRKDTDDK